MSFLKELGAGLKRQMASVPLDYLGGHPELQGIFAGGVGKSDTSLIVYSGPSFKPVLEIPKASIINVSLERANKRSLGKAAAGAVVGGVLTGGIGALAGAAIGGRSKDASIIVMKVKYGQMEVDMLFGGKDTSKKYNQFMALLK